MIDVDEMFTVEEQVDCDPTTLERRLEKKKKMKKSWRKKKRKQFKSDVNLAIEFEKKQENESELGMRSKVFSNKHCETDHKCEGFEFTFSLHSQGISNRDNGGNSTAINNTCLSKTKELEEDTQLKGHQSCRVEEKCQSDLKGEICRNTNNDTSSVKGKTQQFGSSALNSCKISGMVPDKRSSNVSSRKGKTEVESNHLKCNSTSKEELDKTNLQICGDYFSSFDEKIFISQETGSDYSSDEEGKLRIWEEGCDNEDGCGNEEGCDNKEGCGNDSGREDMELLKKTEIEIAKTGEKKEELENEMKNEVLRENKDVDKLGKASEETLFETKTSEGGKGKKSCHFKKKLNTYSENNETERCDGMERDSSESKMCEQKLADCAVDSKSEQLSRGDLERQETLKISGTKKQVDSKTKRGSNSSCEISCDVSLSLGLASAANAEGVILRFEKETVNEKEQDVTKIVKTTVTVESKKSISTTTETGRSLCKMTNDEVSSLEMVSVKITDEIEREEGELSSSEGEVLSSEEAKTANTKDVRQQKDQRKCRESFKKPSKERQASRERNSSRSAKDGDSLKLRRRNEKERCVLTSDKSFSTNSRETTAASLSCKKRVLGERTLNRSDGNDDKSLKGREQDHGETCGKKEKEEQRIKSVCKVDVNTTDKQNAISGKVKEKRERMCILEKLGTIGDGSGKSGTSRHLGLMGDKGGKSSTREQRGTMKDKEKKKVRSGNKGINMNWDKKENDEGHQKTLTGKAKQTSQTGRASPVNVDQDLSCGIRGKSQNDQRSLNKDKQQKSDSFKDIDVLSIKREKCRNETVKMNSERERGRDENTVKEKVESKSRKKTRGSQSEISKWQSPGNEGIKVAPGVRFSANQERMVVAERKGSNSNPRYVSSDRVNSEKLKRNENKESKERKSKSIEKTGINKHKQIIRTSLRNSSRKRRRNIDVPTRSCKVTKLDSYFEKCWSMIKEKEKKNPGNAVPVRILKIDRGKALVLKRRHVNQLFIRGDNIIMVAYENLTKHVEGGMKMM